MAKYKIVNYRAKRSAEDAFTYPYFLRSECNDDVAAIGIAGAVLYDMHYRIMKIDYHTAICFEL